MSGGIRLHKEHGVNAHLTVCCRCGGESPELILTGHIDKIWKCNKCGLRHLQNGEPNECKRCHTRAFSSEDCGPGVSLPSQEPCDKCKEEIRKEKDEIEKGGVYFKCKCGQNGVVRAGTDLAVRVRKHSKIYAPNPVGVELDVCPVCEKPEGG